MILNIITIILLCISIVLFGLDLKNELKKKVDDNNDKGGEN